jgi:hypothetical protein
MKCDLGQGGVSKLYKRKVDEEDGGWVIRVTLRFGFGLDCLLVRSWDFPARLGVVAQPCEASWEARSTIWTV